MTLVDDILFKLRMRPGGKPRYRSILAETATTLRTMRIDVFLVDEDGEATEWQLGSGTSSNDKPDLGG